MYSKCLHKETDGFLRLYSHRLGKSLIVIYLSVPICGEETPSELLFRLVTFQWGGGGGGGNKQGHYHASTMHLTITKVL